MIRISIGNLGSGKTATEIKELANDRSGRKTYSNIKTSLKNVVILKPEMIVKKTRIGMKAGKPLYELKLNSEFWRKMKQPINLTLDEAHLLFNSRKSMHKVNIITTDWLSLARKMLGENSKGQGKLVFITQLPNKLDTLIREMATNIKYHVCRYEKHCKKCGYSWNENSEMPEHYSVCFACGSNDLIKKNHAVEVWEFAGMRKYEEWNIGNRKSYFKHYIITDIEKYFSLYDTMQWDDLFSKFY